jgi:hypothetical protein
VADEGSACDERDWLRATDLSKEAHMPMRKKATSKAKKKAPAKKKATAKKKK